MKEKWKDAKKENRLGFIVLIASIVICIISVSYAMWKFSREGKKENEITTTGSVTLELTDESEGISLVNAIPVSDRTGLSYTPYTFKIRNGDTNNYSYKIYLEEDTDSYTNDGCQENKLSLSNIKYAISENQDPAKIDLLSKDNGLLFTGGIGSKEIKSYTLRIWIKSDATNEIANKHYHGRIKVEATS